LATSGEDKLQEFFHRRSKRIYYVGWDRPVVYSSTGCKLSDQTQHTNQVFYYTLQHVSAVQISHHPVDIGYTQKKYKGREVYLYRAMNYNNIIP